MGLFCQLAALWTKVKSWMRCSSLSFSFGVLNSIFFLDGTEAGQSARADARPAAGEGC